MDFTLKTILEASPAEVYKAWLSSEGHTNMTGGKAIASDKVEAKFTSWDGYIFGKNILLEQDQRIIQTWRSLQFNDNEEDSILEIILNQKDDKTELILIHTNLPENGENYEAGWDEHYFQPMKMYFSRK